MYLRAVSLSNLSAAIDRSGVDNQELIDEIEGGNLVDDVPDGRRNLARGQHDAQRKTQVPLLLPESIEVDEAGIVVRASLEPILYRVCG